MEDAGVLGDTMILIRSLIFTTVLILTTHAVSSARGIGPYSGQVIDGQTGEPIEGASVLIYWTKLVPQIIESSSETIEVRLAYTDRNGRYDIPRFYANLGLTSFFESTNVIIYEPGYQAYIVTVWHDSPYAKPPISFREKDHVIRLDRIPPNFSHREHYKKIEDALWGIDDDPPFYMHPEQPVTWEKRLKIYLRLKGFHEKEEFLRRVEWEDRRAIMEEGW